MECPRCHAENRADRRFCAGCGAPLVVTCRSCHFVNEPDAKFCGGCGAALAAPPVTASPTAAAMLSRTPAHLAERILSTRHVLEGERKQVTVLFADLRGSMELLAGRDPEEAREILDPVLQRMIAAVHRFEGTVNQVMGDGIMALFGAPIAHEDHAVRAGYAALTMLDAIATHADELQRQRGVYMQVRIGLNSGEVVVRGIGNDLTMDYSAIGQTTHLAARMEQLAAPGTIMVTEAFARLAEGYLHFKPLGLVAIKGLRDPIDALQLVEAEPTRTRFQAAATRGLTRFVGRGPELTMLGRALALAETGHGQAVAVIGEPGIGKSRLFYEFIDSERVRGWRVLETGSVSYSKANAYLPVRDLLKSYFQLEDRDEPARVVDKITARLRTLDESLLPALPALLSVLDVPTGDAPWQELDPQQRRRRILDGVKRLLLRQSQAQPLLLIFENLHWIDQETQAVLDSLIESLPTARVLLLVNYRPEYQHTWGSKTYYTQLRLDPLPADSVAALLSTLLGEDAGLDALKALLIRQTEGNPFFLEESIRTLVETKALVGERGARRLARDLPAIQVPPTVQAILAARIDRLPADDKGLLQSAAVIGREISFPLLLAVTGLSEDVLRGGLARLQAAEFIYETALYPELEYTFKHALTLDVAYGSLLQERRRALHLRIVEAMEAIYPDRLGNAVERLAYHAFRGEAWDKAIAYAREAGTRLAARSAYREAVGYFDQALDALERDAARPESLQRAFDLRMEMRTWLVPLGDYNRILGNLTEAEAIARRIGDRRRLGLVRVHMTDYLRLTGQSVQAVQSGEEALATATELDDFQLRVLARVVCGHAYHAVGDYRRATALLRENIEAIGETFLRERFGSAGLPAVLSRGYMVLSLADLGAFDEAITVGTEAVRLAEEFDNPHSHAVVSHALGIAHLVQGDLDRAIPLLEDTLARCRAHHIPMGSRLLASALGYAYALSGRVKEGAPLLLQAIRQAEELNVVFRYALWLTWLGETYSLAGRTTEALQLADRALERTRARGERGHEAYALRLVGELAAGQPGQAKRAEDVYRQALVLTEQLGMRPLEAHCRVGLGALHQEQGRPDQAHEEASRAAALFRSMNMTFWLNRAETLLPRG
jgi:predicted ATPase/class 3 adenylate cyclase